MDQGVREKLSDFFAQYEITNHPKGSVLIQAGQEPAGVSLLVSGLVEQYDLTPAGNKITVNVFKPGAFFPMSWATNGTPNSYFFGTVTEAELRQADAGATVTFLRDNPDVMFDLLSRVYRGTDGLLRRLALTASGIAASRLIFELLIEAYRFGVDAGDSQTLIKVRHHNLAARSGLARETVSRELHKLEKDGFINLTKQGIVLNIEQLEKKLDFSI